MTSISYRETQLTHISVQLRLLSITEQNRFPAAFEFILCVAYSVNKKKKLTVLLIRFVQYFHYISFVIFYFAMDLVLQIQQGRYPFGKCGLKVEERQYFSSIDELQEKERFMIKRDQMLSGPYIVKLLATHKEGLTLKYNYQYIPHSLESYMLAKWSMHQTDWENKKTQIIKKLVYQITMMVGFLARNRVETDLKEESLGVTEAQKIKIYLGPKSRMGIRSQLFLIAHYGKVKEQLIKHLHNLAEAAPTIFKEKHQTGQNEESIIVDEQNQNLPRRKKPSPLNVNRWDKNSEQLEWALQSRELEQSKSKDWASDSRDMSWGFKSSELKPNQRGKNKNKLKSKFIQRKMSANDLNFQPMEYTPSQYHYDSSAGRKHKYSFNMLNNSAFQEPECTPQEPSPTKTKSIRIEMEQQPGGKDQKGKKRKDSYKVKITTYRQYEINDPQQLFEGDDAALFDYFAQKHKQEERQPQNEGYQQDNSSNQNEEVKKQMQAQFQQFDAERKKAEQNTTAPSTPSLKLKKAMSTEQITQQVKLARKRSNQVIEKIKQWRK